MHTYVYTYITNMYMCHREKYIICTQRPVAARPKPAVATLLSFCFCCSHLNGKQLRCKKWNFLFEKTRKLNCEHKTLCVDNSQANRV